MKVVQKISYLIRAGEALAAYDLAIEEITKDNVSPTKALLLKHRAVLCLLRTGATEQARLDYQRFGLEKITDNEDVNGLGARLLKEAALKSTGEKRVSLAKRAAKKYGLGFLQTGGFYSAINQATLSLIAGEAKKSKTLAKKILENSPMKKDSAREKAYFQSATLAEAYLLLENEEKAKKALAQAIKLDPSNLAARATTLHQLAVILNVQNKSKDWLDPYRSPKIAHFEGHMFSLDKKTNQKEKTVNQLCQQIDEILGTENIGVGYGALAAGSDILIAEAILKSGGELHVILPVPVKAFIQTSVAPFGEVWVKRFEICKARATSVHYATENLDYMDHSVISFSNQIAMGLAILKATMLETQAVQILLWDGRKNRKAFSTASDKIHWQSSGRKQIILNFPNSLASKTPKRANLASIQVDSRRTLMAMLFADVKGYGTLTEGQILIFINTIFPRLAKCCQGLETSPAFSNTWGDGLFLAFTDIKNAAEIAIRLQECFRETNLKNLNLPENLSLRIGGHYGPVYENHDSFTGQNNIFGSEVTFAARIEPVTPPGSILVSSQFASILASSGSTRFQCNYAGQIAVSKKKEKVPLFILKENETLTYV